MLIKCKLHHFLETKEKIPQDIPSLFVDDYIIVNGRFRYYLIMFDKMFYCFLISCYVLFFRWAKLCIAFYCKTDEASQPRLIIIIVCLLVVIKWCKLYIDKHLIYFSYALHLI